MEVGESATGPGSGDDPNVEEKKLTLEVIEVEFLSTVKVAYAKAAVSPPHYKKGDNYIDGSGYSERPAVILMKSSGDAGSTNSAKLTVKVEVTENLDISGNGTLIGTIGALRMTGDCPTGVGTHTVDVEIEELPETIIWENSEISWGIEIAAMNQTLPVNNTRVELFGIPDKPQRAFKSAPGVWSEVLRFLCMAVAIVGERDKTALADMIAVYFHSRHGLEYDHERGAPHYINLNASIFPVEAHMRRANGTIVNCYDQASAVQVYCAALGLDCPWLFLDPFGYIQSVWLVGPIRCNNPFFRSAGGSADVIDTPATHTAYLSRSSFGNHAFCSYQGKILDACAGPATGTDSPQQYLDKSIDYATHTELVGMGYSVPAGYAANIVEMGQFVATVS